MGSDTLSSSVILVLLICYNIIYYSFLFLVILLCGVCHFSFVYFFISVLVTSTYFINFSRQHFSLFFFFDIAFL